MRTYTEEEVRKAYREGIQWGMDYVRDGVMNALDEDALVQSLNPTKKWRYSISTHVLWASFDFGEVEALTYEEAYEIAREKLQYDFTKANQILNSCDPTIGFELGFDASQIEIEEIK